MRYLRGKFCLNQPICIVVAESPVFGEHDIGHRYATGVPTQMTQTEQGGKPRFDKRSIFAGLIIWAVAIVLFTVALGFSYWHQPATGERDLGTGVVLFTGFFAAILVFMGGAMSMALGLVNFLWRLWRFSRRQIAVAESD
jgi:hypothetical protein